MVFSPYNLGNIGTGDTIRFNLDIDGFWDPYSAYIEIEVDCSNTLETG
jgi:hypothetical protein